MKKSLPFAPEETLPLIPLRDLVVYPEMVIPLFVGRERSVNAIECAIQLADKQLLLVAQREAGTEDPQEDDIHRIGTLANILQLLRLPDGTLKILVEGQERVDLSNLQTSDDDYLTADYAVVADIEPAKTDSKATLDALKGTLAAFAQNGKKLPKEVLASLLEIERLPVMVDSIAMHLLTNIDRKQKILEILDVAERAEAVLGMLDIEEDMQKVDKKLRSRVRQQMEKNQRDYYLNEKIKAIQKELGESEGGSAELDALTKKIEQAKMPASALDKAMSELGKMKMMSPMSAEASVLRNYLDWLVAVPWHKKTRLRHDLKKAEQVLEEDHHGLEEIKERILEFLAVQQRVKKLRGPILCLIGPPGVGKTSLGESIARATNRKFVRMALGGVRDEAEIRGHRRTYIGSMPGKIVQKLARVEVKNPLFLLDEVDKMGMDYRGDPAAALLEVLDSEQNSTFNDHYLEVDYDLSEVLFVCTANSMNIPGPLLDRMEVIRLPGYTEDEKIAIAERYLLPRQSKAHGLKKTEAKIGTDALRIIIRRYTKEAGVRGLDRMLAKLCRKVVMRNSRQAKPRALKIGVKHLHSLLGVEKFTYGRAAQTNRIGQATGLAWTEVGGEILTIETSSVDGTGKVVKTGSLGDVMQESIQAALTVVRGRLQSLGLGTDYYESKDLHIHIPEGATPKDGPSAGVAMVVALVSELAGIAVRSDVAMTGEITLRGEVLPIGGVKEKLLAAHRAGVGTVIIPQENEKNLAEVPDNIKQHLQIKTAQWIDEVLELALEAPLKPQATRSPRRQPTQRGKKPPSPRPQAH